MNKTILVLKILTILLFSALFILVITIIINFYYQRSLAFFYTIEEFFKTSQKNIKKAWIIFTMLTVLGFIASTYLIFHRKINSLFLKRDSGENKTTSNWFWNQKTKQGSYWKYKKQFLSKNYDNPNWLISFKKSKWRPNKKIKWYANDKKSDINALIIGATGSGKTQKILLPNLLYNMNLDKEHKPCFVITDPKKEIIQFVGKKLEDNGYKIYAIDFLEPKFSLKWNPLSDILEDINNAKDTKEFEEVFLKGIQNINNVIESLAWSKEDDGKIWNQLGKQTSSTIIKFLLYLNLENPKILPKEHFNLTTACSFFDQSLWTPEAKWIKFLQQKANDKDSKYQQEWSEVFVKVQQFINLPKETFGSVFATTISAFKIFTEDKIIQEMTKETISFNLNKISKSNTPYAIFINYPDHRRENHFLVSLLIEQIYRNLIDFANSSVKKRLDRKVLFMLDEFGNLPNIPDFQNKITICRSRNVFFNIVLQDFSQLEKYNSRSEKAHKTIKNNAQFTYFIASDDYETLKTISNDLGTEEVEVLSYTNSAKNSSTNKSKKDKPVMKPGDIKFKNANYMIVSRPGIKPMFIKTPLAYEYFENDNYVFDGKEFDLSKKTFLWNPQEIYSYEVNGQYGNFEEIVRLLAMGGDEKDIKDTLNLEEKIKNHSLINDESKKVITNLKKEIDMHKDEKIEEIQKILLEKEAEQLIEINKKTSQNYTKNHFFDQTASYKAIDEIWNKIVINQGKIKSYKQWQQAFLELKKNNTDEIRKKEQKLKSQCFNEFMNIDNKKIKSLKNSIGKK